jgi:GR25 family glycosyltransferase involved in LPS biosynthesis
VLGGCGYLIKQDAARRMLRYGARPFMPIDQTLDRYWENGILPYVLRPFPIRQCAGIASEIGDRKIKLGQGLYPTLARRTRRAFDGLNKRRFHFTHMGGWRRLGRAAMARARVQPSALFQRTLWRRSLRFGAEKAGGL